MKISGATHQVSINVVVQWLADENCPLHKTYEAPERLRFVFDFA